MPLPCQCPLKEALKKDDYDEVVYYIGRGANSKRLDPFGFTFLSTMAERGNYNAMRALLDSKVDVDIPNSDKSTPLFSAVLSNDVKAIALLASRGADVNATGIQKMTALHQAAAAGTKASARALIKLGAKRHAKDSSGYTPFDLTNSPLTPIYKKMRGTPEYVDIQKLLQDGCPGGRAPALLAEAATATAGRPESKDRKGDKKAEDGKGN
jgi:ankyrin repeat protein